MALNLTRPRIAAVLGSGGHTAEMFRMIKNLDASLLPRIFFCTGDDKLAQEMVRQFEECCLRGRKCQILTIPRPRKVGQSYFSSIFTTMWAVVYCIWRISKIEGIDLVSALAFWQSKIYLVDFVQRSCNHCLCSPLYICFFSSILPVSVQSNIGLDLVAKASQNHIYWKLCADQTIITNRNIDAISCRSVPCPMATVGSKETRLAAREGIARVFRPACLKINLKINTRFINRRWSPQSRCPLFNFNTA